jgi:hypothetical protein
MIAINTVKLRSREQVQGSKLKGLGQPDTQSGLGLSGSAAGKDTQVNTMSYYMRCQVRNIPLSSRS